MKLVLVTGGNRGIGFEICRQLDKLGFTVVLGSRDYSRGKEAASILSENVIVKQLDVTNEDSIQSLFEYIKEEFGQLDGLINNAGLGTNYNFGEKSFLSNAKKTIEKTIPSVRQVVKKSVPLLKKAGLLPPPENVINNSLSQSKKLMETNFYGAWRMIQVFAPLLLNSRKGRIINMSSGMGEFNNLNGEYPAYRISKSSLNALTIMCSKEFEGRGLKVNAMCPGWVKTDMGGPDAPREVSEGADTAVWLLTENDIPTGKFFRDRKEIVW